MPVKSCCSATEIGLRSSVLSVLLALGAGSNWLMTRKSLARRAPAAPWRVVMLVIKVILLLTARSAPNKLRNNTLQTTLLFVDFL